MRVSAAEPKLLHYSDMHWSAYYIGTIDDLEPKYRPSYQNIYAPAWLQLRGLLSLNSQIYLLFLIGTTLSVLLVLSSTVGIRLTIPCMSFQSPGLCYINCDGNSWHFCANLSFGVLPVQEGDLAHIGNVQKPSSPTTPSWLWPRVWGFSYQLLRHWQSRASSKWATVDTCQLLKDDGKVSSRKGDSGTVLSSSSKKGPRSGGLQSEERLIST